MFQDSPAATRSLFWPSRSPCACGISRQKRRASDHCAANVNFLPSPLGGEGPGVRGGTVSPSPQPLSPRGEGLLAFSPPPWGRGGLWGRRPSPQPLSPKGRGAFGFLPSPLGGEGPGVRGIANEKDPALRDRARLLRRNTTPAERILWSDLRGRRFADFKFRRQQIIGAFIVDFFCAEIALVVELDGETHLGKESLDQRRQAWLEGQGFRVLRFWNTDVYEDHEVVLEAIWAVCDLRRGKVAGSP